MKTSSPKRVLNAASSDTAGENVLDSIARPARAMRGSSQVSVLFWQLDASSKNRMEADKMILFIMNYSELNELMQIDDCKSQKNPMQRYGLISNFYWFAGRKLRNYPADFFCQYFFILRELFVPLWHYSKEYGNKRKIYNLGSNTKSIP